MAAPRLGLREIGTAYLGKEPSEYTADVLRQLLQAAGGELGFDSCLTSRPFTARTFVADRLGAGVPGRSDATGRDRADLDMTDGLDGLAALGFRVAPGELPAALRKPRARVAILVGPLRVHDRWCPTADRVLHGDAWRFVVIERILGDTAVFVDPVFGGYTSASRTELLGAGAEVLVVRAPPKAPDPQAAARRCLSVGAGWRARAAAAHDSADRDAAGFGRSAGRAAELVTGAAARRHRLSLRCHAFLASRWSVLLGHVGPLGMDGLALAHVLNEMVVACRAADAAVLAGHADRLADQMRLLTRLADAVTELAERIAAREGR